MIYHDIISLSGISVVHAGGLDGDYDKPADNGGRAVLDFLFRAGVHRGLRGRKPHIGSGGHQVLISPAAGK